MTEAMQGVEFDFDGNSDRIKEHLSWTQPNSDDAWLVLDRNGNGIIDSSREMFGNYTPQSQSLPGVERNGFLALAEFDNPAKGGNGDRVIDRRDFIFSSLQLWHVTPTITAFPKRRSYTPYLSLTLNRSRSTTQSRSVLISTAIAFVTAPRLTTQTFQGRALGLGCFPRQPAIATGATLRRTRQHPRTCNSSRVF